MRIRCGRLRCAVLAVITAVTGYATVGYEQVPAVLTWGVIAAAAVAALTRGEVPAARRGGLGGLPLCRQEVTG